MLNNNQLGCRVGRLRRFGSALRGPVPRLLTAIATLLPAMVLGLPAAADPLQEALGRLQADEALVADAAVEELVALGAPAVEALLPLLNDDRRDVLAGAIRGLGLLGDPRASAPMRRLLRESQDRQVPDDMAARYHRILLVQALGRLRDDESAVMFQALVDSPDPFERAHAAISLFLTGVDPGYALVRTSLEDADPAIRCLVVEGVGESRHDTATALLLPRTGDESWLVRDTAFRALAPYAAEAAVKEAYQRGANDPSWYVRQTVTEFAPD